MEHKVQLELKVLLVQLQVDHKGLLVDREVLKVLEDKELQVDMEQLVDQAHKETQGQMEIVGDVHLPEQ